MFTLFVVILCLTSPLDSFQPRKSSSLLSSSIPTSTTTAVPSTRRVKNDTLGNYREVEEIIPSNEVDGETEEPEVLRQPEAPPHEPESAPIDPNTPGYTGPQPPAVPPQNRPSFPVPPSPGADLPGIAPSSQPGIIPLPPAPTDTKNQPSPPQYPELSPYYPPSTAPTSPHDHPETYYPSPPPAPTTFQYPVSIVPSSIPPPPPPPPATVYSSYSSPAWLNNFYTPSTVYYPNYHYNSDLVSTHPTFSSTLKSTVDQTSYLISQFDSAQLTAVAPYLASPATATHSQINSIYWPQDTNQIHITDNTHEQQLVPVNPFSTLSVDLYKPTQQPTTTESSIEKDIQSKAEADRFEDI